MMFVGQDLLMLSCAGRMKTGRIAIAYTVEAAHQHQQSCETWVARAEGDSQSYMGDDGSCPRCSCFLSRVSQRLV
ncbi:hypothetical protein P692DRAFT_20840811, partial [Suillus brevipes Sb2]